MAIDLIERNINDCPDYCIERQPISVSDDRLHLLEVNGVCPFCGNMLINTGTKKTKQYEIAHIYPNSPSLDELMILDGVTVFGENSESFQNKIALCFNCHKNYDFHKTVEEYNKVLAKKHALYTSETMKAELSNIDVPQNIETLLDKIATLNLSADDIELRLKPLEIKQKFSKSESALKSKVTSCVTEYFVFIRNYFKNLEDTKQLNFSKLAATIKLAYLTAFNSSDSKNKIFDSLVKWLLSKTNSEDSAAAEIVISYFVQNCEVFDEITE
mgnify:CR=1 FL=1